MPELNNSSGRSAAEQRFTAPQLSLPKGASVIRGIGEKFAVNSVTGTGSPAVSVATPPSRSGFSPSLPSITRKTDQKPPGTPGRRGVGRLSLLSGAQDLDPCQRKVLTSAVRSVDPDATTATHDLKRRTLRRRRARPGPRRHRSRGSP